MKKKFSLKKTIFVFAYVMVMLSTHVLAVDDMWSVANDIIVDVYNKIAGISTVLAGLMTAVCCLGMKLNHTQQKNDQQLDWLKKIWSAWAIINGIGAFLAYVSPLFEGLATIEI